MPVRRAPPPSSVEGPFHAPAPPRENGTWVSNGPERQRGDTMVARGRVTDTEGKPIEAATVDSWQADDAGHYDSQDAAQELGNLRGLCRPAPTARSSRTAPPGT